MPGDAGDAGVEALMFGLRLRVLRETAIALGGPVEATLNGAPLPAWTAVRMCAGDELELGKSPFGLRSYVAIAGGIDVPAYVGSRSLLVRGRIGGVEGRALKRGDVLSTYEPRASLDAIEGCRVPERLRPDYDERHTLRVLLGPQDYLFTEESVETFLTSDWRVTPVADRVAVRFSGPRLSYKPRGAYLDEHAGPDPSFIVVDPVPVGGVQVAADGQLMIMGVDAGSLGGFAKIACVATSDGGRMGQLRPGEPVRFEAIDHAAALALREAQERAVAQTAAACGAALEVET